MSKSVDEILNNYAKNITLEDKTVKNENIKLAYPGPNVNPYKEDVKTIEDKYKRTTDVDIIEEAHKDPVYIAESRGDGGLVENQNEQHEKMMTVINKMPTGSLLGTYASVVNELIKIANICDECGQMDAADLITDTAENLAVPFKSAPAK